MPKTKWARLVEDTNCFLCSCAEANSRKLARACYYNLVRFAIQTLPSFPNRRRRGNAPKPEA